MKTNETAIDLDRSLIMRSIGPEDIETLRIWKNEHKEFFFYKNEISPESQLEWYNHFIQQNDDHMFIIENSGHKIGCIGARLYQDGFVDIYNVILGDKNYKGEHIMTNAMDALVSFCNYMYKDKAIRVRVLRNNPAIRWYEKIGFTLSDSFEEYLLLDYIKYPLKKIYPFKIEIELPNLKNK